MSNDTIQHALGSLYLRGPDGSKYTDLGHIVLGHTRLAISDPGSELVAQPITDSSCRYWLVFNGEIYNHRELRASHLSGTEFKTESDTEVLVELLARYGIEKTLELVDGMFSFAFYDTQKNSIYLARDPVGIKPLLYYLDDSALVFASEIATIIAIVSDSKLSINKTSLYDFYTYEYIPAPKTPYNEVFKLQPGYFAEINLSSFNLNLTRYWSPKTLMLNDDCPSTEFKDSKHELELEQYLIDSIKHQALADVNVGILLSGGVDSSLIAAIINKHLPSTRINAFTVEIPNKCEKDAYYAKIVASENCLFHHLIKFPEESYDELSCKHADIIDEPFTDSSYIPTVHVSSYAKKYVDVLLSGDGADELFGGYLWYKRFVKYFYLRRLFRFLLPLQLLTWSFKYLPEGFANRVGALSCHDELELIPLMKGSLPYWKRKILKKSLGVPNNYDDLWLFRESFDSRLPLVKRLQLVDITSYLPNDILVKNDRATMYSSIECRVPFLSRNVISYAIKLAPKLLFDAEHSKILLKRIALKYLSVELVNRPKQGFSIKPKCPPESSSFLKRYRISLDAYNYLRGLI